MSIHDRMSLSSAEEGVATEGPECVGPPARAPEPGQRLGRYRLLARVGRGAMGTVYAAHDPRLDRKVAIKLLHGDAAKLDRRARLLREGKALARLSDPHVVAVFDVGVHEVGGRSLVYVAMEFVEGTTLGGWCRGRSPAAIVAACIDAGRGLAAAHAVGLVHGDFKPDNVLIGADGRARVGDFGLAHGIDLESTTSLPPIAAVDLGTTHAQDLVGTPAYMSPEQFAMLPATAAADQFAFCVTLWEALYGARPFRGSSFAALATAVLAGPPPPPSHPRVPRRVRAVLERGLATDPRQRFPGMDALLSALAPRAAKQRRLVGLALTSFVALGLAAALPRRAPPERRCPRATVPTSDLRLARLRTAFAAEGHDAARAGDDVVATFADWGRRWASERASACTAIANGEPMARETLACIDRTGRQVGTLVDRLADGGDAMMRAAMRVAERLPRAEDCAAPERSAPARRLPTDPIELAELEAVRDEIAVARGLHNAGAYDDVAEMLASVRERADELGDPAVRAEAALLAGENGIERAAVADARAALYDAAWLATEIGDHRLAARAWATLVFLHGSLDLSFADAHRVARFCEAEIAAAGGDAELEAKLTHGRAALAYGEGRIPEAAVLFAAASRTRAQLGQPLAQADALYNLASVEYVLERPADAERHLLESMALWSPHGIGGEPEAAEMRYLLALVRESEGRLDEALAELEEAHRLRVEAFGAEHPETLRTLGAIARVTSKRGDPDAAIALLRESLATSRRVFGATHRHTYGLLAMLALEETQHGEHDQAERDATDAVAIAQSVYGEDHPAAADPLGTLGLARIGLGRHADAIAPLEHALVLVQRSYGDDHENAAVIRIRLAVARRGAGDAAGALADARTAAEVAERTGSAELRRDAEDELARSLAAAKRPPR